MDKPNFWETLSARETKQGSDIEFMVEFLRLSLEFLMQS